MERRSILKVLAGTIAGAIGAALAAPVLALVGHPLRRRAAAPIEPLAVADLARLPEGKPVRTSVVAPILRDAWTRFEKVSLGAVWLTRRGERVQALSTTCPHAGCFVDWEPKQGAFHCPCHGSSFDLDGKCIAGPSPRPMDTLDTEVREGKVLVRFQRFRQAVKDKEPA